MEIEHYSFGRIRIDGLAYDADLIVFPDHVQDHRWRRAGHRLAPEDLASVLADPPQVLVIGAGFYGRMQVPEGTRAALEGAGIALHIANTTEAVQAFNRLQRESARSVAALHLTC
jgi:hypothetical protein